MNAKTIAIRGGLVVLALVLIRWGWNAVKDDAGGMILVYFLTVGVAAGFLAVKYLIPWIGDAVGTAVFSSGEEVKIDGGLKAAAKMAQGDYEGAIAEHEKSLAEDPAQTFPAAEIARICVDNLHDPQRALNVLNTHLASRTWPEDDAAFLRFRIVDIHVDTLGDYETGRDLLQQIIGEFPNTRHSANAHHKLNEVEQAQFKQMTEQRLKGSAGAAN